MKKIFSILAAAIIALSFASCEKNDPGMKFFRLKATITEDSVYIAVNPVDTTAYYYPIFTTARAIESYGGMDSIIAEEIAYFQERVNAGATLEDFDLTQGAIEDSAPIDVLDPNTSYTLAAFEVKLENGKVSCGHVASKTFTTKKIDVVGTVDLGTLEDAELYDLSQYGAYILNSDGDTAAMLLTIYDDKFKGSYSYYDIEPHNSGVWTETYGTHNLVDAKFTTTYKESDKTGKASGWVVGDNGIKYKFSFAFALAGDDPAPARIGKKEFVTEKNNDFRSNLYLLNRK